LNTYVNNSYLGLIKKYDYFNSLATNLNIITNNDNLFIINDNPKAISYFDNDKYIVITNSYNITNNEKYYKYFILQSL
jgi:hypothetical protein